MDSDQITTIIVLSYILAMPFFAVFFFIYFFKHRNLKKLFSGVVSAKEEEKHIREKLKSLFDMQSAKLKEQKQQIDNQGLEYSAGLKKIQTLKEIINPLENAKNLLDRIREIQSELQDLLERKEKLKHELKPLEDTHQLMEDGFQEPVFELDDHADYVFAIKKIREDQKSLVRQKRAIIGDTEWVVGDSRAAGKVMAGRAIRLTLRAFNNECDSKIAKINWKNVDQIRKRVISSFDALNKLNESLNLRISQVYLDLKLREVSLVNEEKIKKQKEKDRLKAQRDMEREEAKAQREIQAEIKRAEKQERQKQQDIAAIREKLQIASAEHREALAKEVAELEEELSAAINAKGRLVSMAEHTRIGHLYVISNRGAFGEKMIKIGMTRRLEPLDRVKELGDASVPFPFDVHAMIFSEDAPKLEKDLHNLFSNYRVNKINKRKEFFNVPLTLVHSELEKRVPGCPFEFESPSMEFAGSIGEVKPPHLQTH